MKTNRIFPALILSLLTSVATTMGLPLPIKNGVLTGPLNANGHAITNVAAVTFGDGTTLSTAGGGIGAVTNNACMNSLTVSNNGAAWSSASTNPPPPSPLFVAVPTYPDGLMQVTAQGGQVLMGDLGGDVNGTFISADDESEQISMQAVNGYQLDGGPIYALSYNLGANLYPPHGAAATSTYFSTNGAGASMTIWIQTNSVGPHGVGICITNGLVVLPLKIY